VLFDWTALTLLYTCYLAGLAWLGRRSAPARAGGLAAAAVAAVLWAVGPIPAPPESTVQAVAWVILPAITLVACYRLSGLFFVTPSPAFERRLAAFDRAMFARFPRLGRYRFAAGPGQGAVELLYFLVYAIVPAGAGAVLAGRPEMLPAYWATVFTADLVCYAALPWIQTRPPRVVEGLDPRGGTGLRPLNLQLLDRTSIQANTVPSGHAASAVAVGLAVFDAWPLAGTILLVVAMGITVATVLGRYHYAIDSLLGVAVAVVSWVGLRA
jgi:hypothetical protein